MEISAVCSFFPDISPFAELGFLTAEMENASTGLPYATVFETAIQA